MTILFWAGIITYGMYDLITMSVEPYLWTQIRYEQEMEAFGQLWGFPFEENQLTIGFSLQEAGTL